MKARVALRKTAAFLLSFALLCGLFPVSAHAEPASLWERLFWNAEPRSEELTDEQRDENVRIATAFLRQELKLPDSAVAAVLANIYRESAFDPLAVDGDREFFGLCQWSKLRWTNCFFFCREQGLDRLSMEGQLAFLKYELEGEYLLSASSLRSPWIWTGSRWCAASWWPMPTGPMFPKARRWTGTGPHKGVLSCCLKRSVSA